MFYRKALFAGLAVTAVAGTASAHFDVRPYLSGGVIVTGGIEDASSTEIPIVRAFGYDFDEDPGDPFTIGDPGFNAAAGALTSSTALHFKVTSNLRYWDGLGAPVFSDVTTGEAIYMTPQTGAGSLLITGDLVTLNGGPVSSPFNIGITAPGGSIHRHNSSQLFGSDGNAVPAAAGLWGAGDGVEAPAGVYAFEMTLDLAGGNTSLPFWIVYNNGLDEETHDATIEHLASGYLEVPEPASLLTLGAGGLMLAVRRRRLAM